MTFYKPNLGNPPSSKPINLNKIDVKGGILIRSTNWLGDAIMTLPAIYKIKRSIDNRGKIIILTTEKLKSFWESVSWIDYVISFPGKRIDQACIQTIKELNPGLGIILPNSFGSAFDLNRAGIPKIIGRTGRGRSIFIDYKLPAWKRRPGRDIYHETQKYLEFSHFLGSKDWDCDYPPISPRLSATELNEIKSRVATDKPLLVVAAGAAYGPAKQWPERYFIEIIEWWTRRYGNAVVIGSESEFQLADNIVKSIPRTINLAGETSLVQLMYILSMASCIATNDSGPMHLGAALGKKGVAMFGSTDPIATGPIGGEWIVHYKKTSCSPCLQRTCKLDNHKYKCLEKISPEEIISTIEKLIK